MKKMMLWAGCLQEETCDKASTLSTGASAVSSDRGGSEGTQGGGSHGLRSPPSMQPSPYGSPLPSPGPMESQSHCTLTRRPEGEEGTGSEGASVLPQLGKIGEF